MSLAYGVDGEIDLLLENNYGDYSDWSREQLYHNIVLSLNSMLRMMDDPEEIKQVKAILGSPSKMSAIADDFIEEHGEYMTKVK
jgi:hypothetical protein